MIEQFIYELGKAVNGMVSAVTSMVPQAPSDGMSPRPQSITGNVVINRETATRQTVPAGYAASQNGQASGSRYGLKFN